MTADVACRHCGVSLASPNNTRREIGYVVHDVMQFWVCPDCGGTWPRFPADHPFHPLAEKLRADYETTAASASASTAGSGEMQMQRSTTHR